MGLIKNSIKDFNHKYFKKCHFKFFKIVSQLLGYGLQVIINFCGGVSKGSGNIMGYVVEFCMYYCCMGTRSLIATPNIVISSLSWTVKISNNSATCISDHLYSKTTSISNPTCC